jgi:hypothetical protein
LGQVLNHTNSNAEGASMDVATLNLDVNPEVASRIIAAANQLFMESGRTAIPNVDTVRRAARVDMNDASRVMRAWRKTQVAAPTPSADAIPNKVHEAGQILMQGLWKEATELANSGLTAAQAGWETERAEAEGLRAQLAGAFDEQSIEMQRLQSSLRDALAENSEYRRCAQDNANEQSRLASHAQAMATEAKNARDRCADLQNHIDDMRTALARAQEQAALIHAEGSRAAADAATEVADLHVELLRSAERLATANEEAAVLRSELKIMGKQLQLARSGEEVGSSPGAAKPSTSQISPRVAKRRGNGGDRR